MGARRSDPLTTVSGRVTDESGRPVAGAKVALRYRGIKAEIYDFQSTLVEMPDLDGGTPAAVLMMSSLNLRNPERVFGQFPFGSRWAPDFAARLTGMLQVETEGEYTFVLRSHEGARMRIGGTTVLEVPRGGIQSAEGVGKVKLAAGCWPIEIVYWEALGPSELVLDWLGPDGVRRPISPSALWTDSETLVAVTDEAGRFTIGNVPVAMEEVEAVAQSGVDGMRLKGVSGRLKLAGEAGRVEILVKREMLKEEVLK